MQAWPWMAVPVHFGQLDSSFAIPSCSSLCCLYEASALDPTEPVTLTIDLGGKQKLESLAIAWEFPAKSFAISVSSDGVKWVEVFATDSNVLASTQVSLGAVTASKVKVVMHEVLLLQALFEESYPLHLPGSRATWSFSRSVATQAM